MKTKFEPGVPLKSFNQNQKFAIKSMAIVSIIGLLGILALSFIGAEYHSLHIIDITSGLWERVYNGVTTLFVTSFSYLLGVYTSKLMELYETKKGG